MRGCSDFDGSHGLPSRRLSKGAVGLVLLPRVAKKLPAGHRSLTLIVAKGANT
jgi:hypothetical protein